MSSPAAGPSMDRRSATAWIGAALLPTPARARDAVIDGAGRRVPTPGRVERIFPAGPPAAIQVYTLAPQALLGWPRANRAEEREFLLPGVGERPALGRLTGRGDTASLETVLGLQPDLIVDAGSVRRTHVELADRVQAQTGIPYALLDGRFEAIPASYEVLGRLCGRVERARELAQAADDLIRSAVSRVAAIPASQRPRVYCARGPAGLETGLAGSINVEIVEVMGLRLVSADRPGGLAQVSIEQILRWDPEVILTVDAGFARAVREHPLWRQVSAVRAGRVHLAPRLPFGWIDFPPGVNRLPGLSWIGQAVFPQVFTDDLRRLTRDFYRLFYQVELSAAQLDRVLAG